MAIALKIHGSCIKYVHDQAAAKAELMLVCRWVELSHIGMLLLDDVDEKRCVFTFDRHADSSYG